MSEQRGRRFGRISTYLQESGTPNAGSLIRIEVKEYDEIERGYFVAVHATTKDSFIELNARCEALLQWKGTVKGRYFLKTVEIPFTLRETAEYINNVK